jgi:RimJ/RimL family protein N-acetyltransferase
MLREADIVMVRGKSWASRLIAELTRSPGEAPTRVTHVALCIAPDEIIEAQWGGVRRCRYYGGDVYRPINLKREERKKIAAYAKRYDGARYGYGKIVLHALDGLLGGIYFFRRLAFVKRWPICSWLVAESYASEGYMFGVPTGAATPDDIDDFVRSRLNKFQRIK